MSGRIRIDRIRNAIAKLGPSTVRQIAEETGMFASEVGLIIRDSRKKNWPGARIRKAGKTPSGGNTRSWLYDLGDEPDAVVEPLRNEPSRRKRLKHPGLTREEIIERKRLQQQAAQIKPFHDPMIWATAGRQA